MWYPVLISDQPGVIPQFHWLRWYSHPWRHQQLFPPETHTHIYIRVHACSLMQKQKSPRGVELDCDIIYFDCYTALCHRQTDCFVVLQLISVARHVRCLKLGSKPSRSYAGLISYRTPIWKFTYLGSSVSSTEKDIDTRLTKAWTAIDRLSIVWKSDLTDKMKRSFFQAAVVSILLYGCTTWTLTKRLERKLDGNYTRMLRAVLNKSWRQHPTRLQLYGHLPPITKTIQVRRTRHAGHCWRSKDELISDVLLWTPTYGCAKVGRPARTYIQQLCEDTGCNPEDLPEAMNDREKWRERVRDIHAGGATWWWWWWWWWL